MAIDFNGFGVLRSIGAHAGAFPDIAAEAKKAARTLVVKQLKKSRALNPTREIRKAIGEETFGLIVDGMTDAEVKTLIGKLDKYHPDLKTSGPGWRRQQFLALADGSIEPTEKPPPRTKSKSARSSKARKEEPSRLSSVAMGAVRRRRD
jgi:hypothetical protein